MRDQWQEDIEPGIGTTAALKILGKAMIEPAVLAFLVLLFTMGLWLPPAVHYLGESRNLGSGSLVIWGVLAIGVLLLLSGAGHFAGWTLRLAPYARELRAAKQSGNRVRIDLALDAWRVWSSRRRFSALWTAMLSIFLILPSWVALAKSTPQPAPVKEKAHVQQGIR